MHETIEKGRTAIKETVDLLHSIVLQMEQIAPVFPVIGGGSYYMIPEPHQATNELTRLCLDATKKISIQIIRPGVETDQFRAAIHEFGFVTGTTEYLNCVPNLTLLIATDQKAIDVWMKYKLSTYNDGEHPFLVGWMLGYPTTSIADFWNETPDLKSFHDRDRMIYREEFGYEPNDSVGFNWIYEKPV